MHEGAFNRLFFGARRKGQRRVTPASKQTRYLFSEFLESFSQPGVFKNYVQNAESYRERWKTVVMGDFGAAAR